MSENENLSLEVFDSPEFGQMRILREGDKYLFLILVKARKSGRPFPPIPASKTSPTLWLMAKFTIGKTA